MSEVRAVLIAIGDELMAGAHPDFNSPTAARVLERHGVSTQAIHVIADEEAELAELMRDACRQAPLVIASGGLGPTLDDVTRHAAARAAGEDLVMNPEALEELRAWFASQERAMPAANDRQALVPASAVVFPNAHGTAPGFRVRVGESWLCCLPGPPREYRPMLEDAVLPWLIEEGRARPSVAEARFHLSGLPESEFADRCGDWMARDADPIMGVTAKGGVMSVRMRGRTAGSDSQARLEERARAFRGRFEEYIYSETEPRLEFVLGQTLIERGLTVSLAESCTGGLATQRLSRVPGMSAVLLAGLVTYSNASKVRELDVPPELIAEHGAVSAEVAEVMALGVAHCTGSRLAVSITGVAGPDGGTPEKPVGLVWFGICVDGMAHSVRWLFPAVGREAIQRFAALRALDLLRRAVDEIPQVEDSVN